MNILTFDIEEWYIEQAFHGARTEKYKEFDNYLNLILDTLDGCQTKATFFCLGKMASDFPDIVKKIAAVGHEVGCHSNKHQWLNKMTREEAFADTRTAVDSLEQCIGKKIKSYRAPAFSIGESNKWAFEVLAECGIERDASVFPAARDFGGFPSFCHKTPTVIELPGGASIHEYPISTANIFGKEVAYSGGYFRFFPLSFVRREMARQDYTMTYFHIGDLLPETSGIMSRQAYEEYFKENGSYKNRLKRYLKSNLGKKNALEKLIKLIRSTEFDNIEEADKMVDWGEAARL